MKSVPDVPIVTNPGQIGAALEAWIEELQPTGADRVRALMAVFLARELDDPETPVHTRSRSAGALRALLLELERAETRTETTDIDRAKRILREVL